MRELSHDSRQPRTVRMPQKLAVLESMRVRLAKKSMGWQAEGHQGRRKGGKEIMQTVSQHHVQQWDFCWIEMQQTVSFSHLPFSEETPSNSRALAAWRATAMKILPSSHPHTSLSRLEINKEEVTATHLRFPSPSAPQRWSMIPSAIQGWASKSFWRVRDAAIGISGE